MARIPRKNKRARQKIKRRGKSGISRTLEERHRLGLSRKVQLIKERLIEK